MKVFIFIAGTTVAGQNTQSQNTQGQSTQAQKYQNPKVPQPKRPKDKIPKLPKYPSQTKRISKPLLSTKCFACQKHWKTYLLLACRRKRVKQFTGALLLIAYLKFGACKGTVNEMNSISILTVLECLVKRRGERSIKSTKEKESKVSFWTRMNCQLKRVNAQSLFKVNKTNAFLSHAWRQKNELHRTLYNYINLRSKKVDRMYQLWKWKLEFTVESN